MMVESLNFLSAELAREIRNRFGSPAYVYDEASLSIAATAALGFPHAYGLTVRYAMKANPNATILRLFDQMGLEFDASSGFEATRAMRAGIAAEKISLSAQEMPADIVALASSGIQFVATSLTQLKTWCAAFPDSKVAIRFNPGVGSGGNNRTNVGGPSASFGIWHEWIDEVREICTAANVTIARIHTHIGSGSDSEVWKRVAMLSLGLVEKIDSVTRLDLGGGYKVARVKAETATDLQEVGESVKESLEEFANRTGREIHLEIEPGTFLLANCGTLLATVQDVVNTGTEGHKFIRTDTGMSDFLRSAMYGAQHPLVVIPANETVSARRAGSYQVVGHCCESSDVMSTAPGDPEGLAARELLHPEVGDLIAIEGAGAYCSSMCAANYNSFPMIPEVLIRADGDLQQIRRRQTLEEIVSLEVT